MNITRLRVASTLLAVVTTFAMLPTANAIVNPDRIVLPGEATWTAMISFDFDGADPVQFCTGALVSPQVVLTAAHCVIDTPMESATIRIGNRTTAPGDGVTRSAAAVIFHGKYERQLSYEIYDANEVLLETVEGDVRPGENSIDSDIALIYLDEPVLTIKPVRLPSSRNYQPKPGWRTYGWGMTGENEDLNTDYLLTAAQDDHTAATAESFEDPFDKILAAVRVNGENSSGTCFGDSGGPLVDRRNVLIGLTSFSESGICSAPVATLFTKVSAFLDWQKRALALAKKTTLKRAFKDSRQELEIPVIGLE